MHVCSAINVHVVRPNYQVGLYDDDDILSRPLTDYQVGLYDDDDILSRPLTDSKTATT